MQVNRIYRPFVEQSPETMRRVQLLIGGRNSGKSRAVAQKIVLMMLRNRVRGVLVRKVADTIRDSQYREIRDVVAAEGLEKLFTFLVNPLTVRSANGSELIIKGFDSVEKMRSLAECNFAWVEEASEITEQEYETLDYSFRGTSAAGLKQIILTQNTVKSFAKDYFFRSDGMTLRDDDIYMLHTTWRDNHFRGEDWERRMEKLKARSESSWQWISEGLWTEMEGLVYKWNIGAFPETNLVRRGLDFGFNDPCALVDVCFYRETFHVRERLYESGLNVNTLNERMVALNIDKRTKILCDAAEKMSIDALYGMGYNVHPGEKPKVHDSVKWLSSFPIVITPESTNIIKEIDTYCWDRDKTGKMLDVPVDWNNHALDAFRYAAIDLMPYTKTSMNEYAYVGGGNRYSAGIDHDAA